MSKLWQRFATASPLTQALGILAALLVLAGLFEGGAAVFGSSPHHAPRHVAAGPTSTPTPTPPVSDTPPPDTSAPVPIPTTSTVATATGGLVVARAQPNPKGKVVASIPPHNLIGQETPFLVLGSQPGWYQVQLPIRPNGSTGWIDASQVTTSVVSDFLLVSLSNYRLDHYVGGKKVDSFPVGLGLPQTPTPTGTYYVWAIQDAPGPPYDPVIFALSAFSPTLLNWPLGGIIGVHGWQDPAVEGKQVSNGCVRMHPADATKLEKNLPLGTPIEIIS